MELNASYISRFGIASLIVELARNRVDSVVTGGTGCDFVAKLFKVVLKDINDLI